MTGERLTLRSGYLVGLTAAILFGLSAPVSKALLDHVGPQMLAGLLYLGAFLAIGPAAHLRPGRRREAPLRRSDVPRLTVVVGAGGVVAPVLLMLGLQRTSGIAGSLALNMEGPLTLLVGVVIFREYLGRRSWLGSGVVFGAAALLGIEGSSGGLDLVGVALILLACGAWAIDNNVTQTLTARDPFAIVTVKTGVAAVVNIGLALLVSGGAVPGASAAISALALGAVAYGISVLLDAYALRLLGAAREAAIFATAPFAGALLAVPLLGDRWGVADLVAAAGMALGVAALVSDRHSHRHVHEPLDHEHQHVHDEHHRHEHAPGTDVGEPHSHPHHHDRLVHTHPHVSDAHHRHPH